MKKNSMNNLFEELLKESAALAAKELGEEIIQGEKEELSKEHQQRMKKMFARAKRKIYMNKFKKYASRAAVLFTFLVVVSGAVVFNVDAFRFRFLNMFTNKQETNTEISFNDGTSYSNGDITLGYVPEGFELEKEENTDYILLLKFINEKEYFTVEKKGTSSRISIDKEDAEVEKMNLNGIDVFYSKKSDVDILTYYIDETTISVYGNTTKDILINIVENIKFN